MITTENDITMTNIEIEILNIKSFIKKLTYFFKNKYTIPYKITLYINKNIQSITNL